MNRRFTILFALVLLSASLASADVVLTIGDYTVAPGGSVQVPVLISGGSSITDADFYFQVDGGLGSNPSITGIDFLTGTIWAGEPASAVAAYTDTVDGNVVPIGDPTSAYGYPQLAMYSIVPNAAHTGTGLLATVTIHAGAGLPNGSKFTLSMVDTMNDSSGFYHSGVPFNVTGGNGSVTVPEPISMSLLGFGAIGLLLRRRRR